MQARSVCWPAWLAKAPSLVAESLARVAEPLATWLRPGPPAPAEAVAAGLAGALLPPEAHDPSPDWLRSDQRLSFRRAVAAVRRDGGALLADGVGTGKTYIALAVGRAIEPGRVLHVIAPATLRSQWTEAASRSEVSIRIHTHETLSRGRAPPFIGGAVIIDESHRFRTSSTRRYATLAPWCAGRRGILLSATPLVNRLWISQTSSRSWFAMMRSRGAGFLRFAAPGAPEFPGAFAALVITGEDRSPLLPARRELSRRPEESRWLPSCCAACRGSRCPPTR